MISITGKFVNMSSGIPSPDNASNGDWYYNNYSKALTYIVSGKGAVGLVDRDINMQVSILLCHQSLSRDGAVKRAFDHSPSTNVTRVRFPHGAIYTWVESPCLEGLLVLQFSSLHKNQHLQIPIAKRAKSRIECKSLNSPRDSVNRSVFWGKYRECRRSFCFSSVLGKPAFAFKEIFKIIHHSSLFVWILSESWRHSGASLFDQNKGPAWKPAKLILLFL